MLVVTIAVLDERHQRLHVLVVYLALRGQFFNLCAYIRF